MSEPALVPNPADAREKMEDWRRYYSEERPHGAIVQKPGAVQSRRGSNCRWVKVPWQVTESQMPPVDVSTLLKATDCFFLSMYVVPVAGFRSRNTCLEHDGDRTRLLFSRSASQVSSQPT